MTIEIVDDQKIYKYYVAWVDQGPAGLVFGSYFTAQDHPIETEADVNHLKWVAGAKDANDAHIVILDWKRLQ